jgi:hypothetical protein
MENEKRVIVGVCVAMALSGVSYVFKQESLVVSYAMYAVFAALSARAWLQKQQVSGFHPLVFVMGCAVLMAYFRGLHMPKMLILDMSSQEHEGPLFMDAVAVFAAQHEESVASASIKFRCGNASVTLDFAQKRTRLDERIVAPQTLQFRRENHHGLYEFVCASSEQKPGYLWTHLSVFEICHETLEKKTLACLRVYGRSSTTEEPDVSQIWKIHE